MSTYEQAKNVFAVIGLLFTSGFISFIGWHAVAAIRRYRTNRPERLRQRAIAAARIAPIPSPYGDDSFGDC